MLPKSNAHSARVLQNPPRNLLQSPLNLPLLLSELNSVVFALTLGRLAKSSALVERLLEAVLAHFLRRLRLLLLLALVVHLAHREQVATLCGDRLCLQWVVGRSLCNCLRVGLTGVLACVWSAHNCGFLSCSGSLYLLLLL